MHLKSKRLAAIVLAMTLLFQTAGCLGTANGFEGKPADTIYSLQSAVQSLNDKDILALTTIEKGSSRYKEYSDILNMDSYTEGAAKCYEAVASAIDVTYDEDSIETGKDIAKVPVTFAIPAWKEIFENSSLSGADSVIEALAKGLLRALIGGVVIAFARHAVGQASHRGQLVLGVVRVLVALAVV